MLFSTEDNARVLLTTPDFPPRLGGLSTFSLNISTVLKNLGIKHDVLVWSSSDKIVLKNEYKLIINIHFLGGFIIEQYNDTKLRHINFCHGSEILFYSSNLLKRLFKLLFRKKMISYLEKSYLNISISEFTRNMLSHKGLSTNYSRDLVLHNCVSTADASMVVKTLDDNELRFVCISRDVAHKNIPGCLNVLKQISQFTNKKLKFFVTSSNVKSTSLVEVIDISSINDQERERVYQTSHFNLLLSLDHSRKGFYEGFGLTVLEAGKYGVPSIVLKTGGLSEAVHDDYTGWVLPNLSREAIESCWSRVSASYKSVSQNCFNHTTKSHSLNQYEKFLTKILYKELSL